MTLVLTTRGRTDRVGAVKALRAATACDLSQASEAVSDLLARPGCRARVIMSSEQAAASVEYVWRENDPQSRFFDVAKLGTPRKQPIDLTPTVARTADLPM